jgi:hypothetical protein
MRLIRSTLVLLVVVFFKVVSGHAVEFPPHIQQVINKAMSGAELTSGEEKSLEEWGRGGLRILFEERSG